MPFLGLVGFFAMMLVVPAVDRWMEHNPWPRYKLAGYAIIMAWGFGSAYLMSGHARGAGDSCYVEWDGRTNPDVCD